MFKRELQDLMAQGGAYIDLAEFDKAEEVFLLAQARWPDRPAPYVGYARTAQLQQRWQEAVDRWQKVLEIFPENIQGLMAQRDAYIELGEYEKADEISLLAQARWPDRPAPYVGYARTAQLQQRWQEAVDRWQKVLEIFPENIQGLMAQRDAYIELGEYEKADEISLLAQARWPGRPAPYVGYARTAQLQQRWQEAVDRWQKVLEISPENMQGLIAQRNAYIELGEYEKADEISLLAQARWPDRPAPYVGYARTAQLQQRWQEAVDRWQKVLEISPENMQGLIAQRNAYIELGEYEKADEISLLAQARWPDKLDPYVGYARTAQLQQRWQEAVDRWQKVLEISPENMQGLMAQGGAYIELGEYEKAEAISLVAQAKEPTVLGPFHLHHRVIETKRRKKEMNRG